MRNAKSSQPARSPRDVRRPARNPRSAFTLIELVVVIMIIAILSSLLLVGVQAAVGRAREAAVSVDIKNLEQAIKEFQSKFGLSEAPPSRIVLYESYGDWPDVSTATGTSAAHKSIRQNVATIRKLWPAFLDAKGKPVSGMGWQQDLNGNGTLTDTLELNGAECLVFFLGGVMESGSVTGTYVAAGFSTDPRDPFKSGGARIGPFATFSPSRLRDSTSNGFPEYVDAFPSSTVPYQYFSAYGGRGYRLLGDDNAAGGADFDKDEALPSTLQVPYLQKDTQWPNPSAMPPIAAGNTPKGTAWNPKGFQIISAGPDGLWGVGGEVSDEDGVKIYTAGMDGYRDTDSRRVEKDNITNFKGGRLN